MNRVACAAFATLAVALASPRVDAQPATRKPVAIVIRISTAPLFTPDGHPAAGRDGILEAIGAKLDALATPAFAATPFGISPSALMCDEAMHLKGNAPRRFLRSLRRVAARAPVLSTPYANVRLPDLADRERVRREIVSGRSVLERCVGKAPSTVLYPPGLALDETSFDGAERAGVTTTLSTVVEEPRIARLGVVPAGIAPDNDTPSALLERTGSDAPFTDVLEADRDDLAPAVTAFHANTSIDLRGVEDLMRGAVHGDVSFPEATPTPESYRRALIRADQALAKFESFTLRGNPNASIFRTLIARARSSADLSANWSDGRHRAARLVAVIRTAERRVSVAPGAITFTSRHGSVPVTVTNRDPYPVRVLVRVTSPKLDFPDGNSRVVTVPPPGDTITFSATARSTGSFPTLISLPDPHDSFVLDHGQLTVRSTAANLPALVLTIGGAFFLIVFYVSRRAKRKSQ